MFEKYLIAVTVLAACLLPCVCSAWEHDLSKFPEDKAVLPARLENMRPGQVRDAVAKEVPCILPIGTIESVGDDSVLGIDRNHGEDALMEMAKQKNAVVAPTVWYGPNGQILSGSAEGTVDIPVDAFSAYIKEVMLTLQAVGFKHIMVVPLHDPQGDPSPMKTACTFAVGDIFNDLWKRPEYGEGWWDKPGAIASLNWNGIGIVELPKTPAPAAKPAESVRLRLPLRLENMRPSEVKKAIAEGLPLFLPVGVLEGHGNQNPIGVDAIEAQDPLVLAAAKQPAVIAPTVWIGPTATACTETKLGSLDINGVAFQKYIDGIITGLAGLGFKTLTVVQCHQGGGAQRQGINMAIQQYRCRLASLPGYGPGWAKRLKPKDMKHCEVEMMGPPNMRSDHAGKNETSWMIGLRPQFTDLGLIRPNDYLFCWAKNDESNTASVAQGIEMVEQMIGDWIKIIQAKTKK